MNQEKLFTPGPAQCLDSALNILAEPTPYHRTDDFMQLFLRAHQKLKSIFKTTTAQTLILNGTGTQAMENAIANLLNPQEEVLVITNGNFGKRFREIGQLYGLSVTELAYEFGTTYELDDVKEQLKVKKFSAIFVTHSETSTGSLQNIEQLGLLTKDCDTLLIVDTISGLVMNPFEFDKWHVDIALSASQKGFMLPAGLNFTCISTKALDKCKTVTRPLFYNGYLKNLQVLEDKNFFWTVNTSLIKALDYVLDYILEIGMDKIHDQYYQIHSYLTLNLLELGFDPYVKGDPSISLVVFKSSPKVNVVEILKAKNIIIAGGLGSHKDQIFRIGVMNNITLEDAKLIITYIKEAIDAI